MYAWWRCRYADEDQRCSGVEKQKSGRETVMVTALRVVWDVTDVPVWRRNQCRATRQNPLRLISLSQAFKGRVKLLASYMNQMYLLENMDLFRSSSAPNGPDDHCLVWLWLISSCSILHFPNYSTVLQFLCNKNKYLHHCRKTLHYIYSILQQQWRTKMVGFEFHNSLTSHRVAIKLCRWGGGLNAKV